MTLEIRTAGYDLAELLSSAPRIEDPIASPCRVLTLGIRKNAGVPIKGGQKVELWYGGSRWYYGKVMNITTDDIGNQVITVYDPLYDLAHNTDDYYIRNMTATQGLKTIAAKLGIPVAAMANTKVVFKALYYSAKEADKVYLDLVARTQAQGGKKYWYRFDPNPSNFGLHLFERTVPKQVWAFEVGVNLEKASKTESAEDLITAVKLVNRDTGKVVVKANAANQTQYGKLQYFEEVEKDEVKTMDKKAAKLLADKGKVAVDFSIVGINPYRKMPQLFCGDVIYVEERNTGLLGPCYIRNITQEFLGDNLVRLAMDVTKTADLPEIQYDDATKAPDYLKPAKKKKKKATSKKKASTKSWGVAY